MSVSRCLSGAFYLSRAILQHMLDRSYGRIINISSVTVRMNRVLEVAPLEMLARAETGMPSSTSSAASTAACFSCSTLMR
jgi:NAD(P)-dependent dehydrogenase (short-subunit alcohol dehydrogenase family)